MTDKPDDDLTPDEPVETPAPEPADLVAEDDGIEEPGLVVEPDEEIDLDDIPDVEPAYEESDDDVVPDDADVADEDVALDEADEPDDDVAPDDADVPDEDVAVDEADV